MNKLIIVKYMEMNANPVIIGVFKVGEVQVDTNGEYKIAINDINITEKVITEKIGKCLGDLDLQRIISIETEYEKSADGDISHTVQRFIRPVDDDYAEHLAETVTRVLKKAGDIHGFSLCAFSRQGWEKIKADLEHVTEETYRYVEK